MPSTTSAPCIWRRYGCSSASVRALGRRRARTRRAPAPRAAGWRGSPWSPARAAAARRCARRSPARRPGGGSPVDLPVAASSSQPPMIAICWSRSGAGAVKWSMTCSTSRKVEAISITIASFWRGYGSGSLGATTAMASSSLTKCWLPRSLALALNAVTSSRKRAGGLLLARDVLHPGALQRVEARMQVVERDLEALDVEVHHRRRRRLAAREQAVELVEAADFLQARRRRPGTWRSRRASRAAARRSPSRCRRSSGGRSCCRAPWPRRAIPCPGGFSSASSRPSATHQMPRGSGSCAAILCSWLTARRMSSSPPGRLAQPGEQAALEQRALLLHVRPGPARPRASSDCGAPAP